MSSTTPGPQQGQPEQRPSQSQPGYSGAPQPGQQGPYGQAGQGAYGQPGPYATSAAHDPNRPGSLAWVEQRHGPVTQFGDRVVPFIVDTLIPLVASLIPFIIGTVLFVAGLPDQEPCYYSYGSCEVPGTGSGAMVALGSLMWLLAAVLYYGLWFWNRVLKVSKTGQSIGRKMSGLKVVNAVEGRTPTLGEAFLRELVTGVAGIISHIWMAIDDDRRTLGDMVGKTAVIKVPKD